MNDQKYKGFVNGKIELYGVAVIHSHNIGKDLGDFVMPLYLSVSDTKIHHPGIAVFKMILEGNDGNNSKVSISIVD